MHFEFFASYFSHKIFSDTRTLKTGQMNSFFSAKIIRYYVFVNLHFKMECFSFFVK